MSHARRRIAQRLDEALAEWSEAHAQVEQTLHASPKTHRLERRLDAAENLVTVLEDIADSRIEINRHRHD